MIPSHPCHDRGRGGFTLLELVAAMAVGMIVLLVAASLLGQTGEGYERVGGGIGAEREARALLTQLSDDMATAYNYPNFERSETAWASDRIGFLTLQPADAQSAEGRIGDLCAVNYYVKDLEIGGSVVRCLMRGFRESRETFDAIRSGDLSGLYEPRERDEPVAFNVVSFAARPVQRGASGEWEAWSEPHSGPPGALDVDLVIARRELAGKLKTAADWNGEGRFGMLLGNPGERSQNKNLEAFGTIIRFGNASPR
jgi:type II secretory pathway component PulJ